ncbi:MAG: cytochrome c3 family protein [Desulfobacterales bacterium]
MRRWAVRRSWILGGLGACLVLLLFCLALGGDRKPADAGRPDWLTLSISTELTADEMPAVAFAHDLHTEALTGQDCTVCHLKDGERIRFTFKQAAGKDYAADMTAFHDNCIGCHVETAQKGAPAGPTTGECRLCHRSTAPDDSAWTAIKFDRSLHYRHQSSARIAATSAKDEANCSACHHEYNADTQTLFYQKGAEGSCRYCHAADDVPNETANGETRSMRRASHDGCVACHLADRAQHKDMENAKFGPITCAGCHEKELQAQVARVEAIPRLKRNQPDAVLLATRFTNQLAASPDAKPAVAAVAFDHKHHEDTVESCRTCHHASLQKCGDCHTPDGAKEGDFIRLEQAMHAVAADQSCIGCHRSAKTAASCAGCHAMLPPQDFAARDCKTCHGISEVDQTPHVIKDPDARSAMASAAVSRRTPGIAMPPDVDIPEIVTIAAISDKYEAVRMPHRKIVKALAERVGDNALAKAFHNEPETLCRGCHHNAAVLPKPPACASCHGPMTLASMGARPSLIGAYHVQCISCHERMGIEKPAATACIACHPLRESKQNVN